MGTVLQFSGETESIAYIYKSCITLLQEAKKSHDLSAIWRSRKPGGVIYSECKEPENQEADITLS